MGKIKGTRFERELFHMFDDAKWQPIRAAGSGSTSVDCVDLVIGSSNKNRILAIECKVLKAKAKYLAEEDILQLNEFANKFGAEAWIAIKFDHFGTYFVKPDKLPKTKSNYCVVSLEFCKENGISFEKLIS